MCLCRVLFAVVPLLCVLCQLYTVTAVKGETLVIQGLNGAPWAPEF